MKNRMDMSKGKVIEMFISQKGKADRVSMQEIVVDENGVWEDKFYGKDSDRSVLITAIDSYKLAEEKNIRVKHGSLGENILMDYNPYNLLVGTQIKVGNAVLEISQNCTLCKSLTKIDKKLPKLLKNDRGVFAKVVKAGIIHEGDDIFIMYFKYEK
jgi:MOSC domain-containing protein YiiM